MECRMEHLDRAQPSAADAARHCPHAQEVAEGPCTDEVIQQPPAAATPTAATPTAAPPTVAPATPTASPAVAEVYTTMGATLQPPNQVVYSQNGLLELTITLDAFYYGGPTAQGRERALLPTAPAAPPAYLAPLPPPP